MEFDTTSDANVTTTPALDRDLGYEEWLDDCRRNELAAEEVEVAPASAPAAAPQGMAVETRVGVKGRRFTAEARLAGGRWVKAGTFSAEADAWRAARARAEQLVATAQKPARAA